jgi:hypothetical protein
MGQNLNSPWHDAVMQVFFILIIFALHFIILEGPPTFGMTPDSVTIGNHTSVNDKVMDIQITDLGDFIHIIELDYDNEYFYFDTRLRTY